VNSSALKGELKAPPLLRLPKTPRADVEHVGMQTTQQENMDGCPPAPPARGPKARVAGGQKKAERPLAIYTDFASPSDKIDKDGVDLGAEKRLFRWELQDAARKLLGRSHRIGTCHRVKAPINQSGQVSVYQKEETRHTYYGGLMVCANLWACPVCAAKIAERRRQELEAAIGLHSKQGGGVYHMLVTLPHRRGNTIEQVVEGLLKSFRSLNSGKRALAALVPSYIGMIRCLEVTYGENGWHPHLHVLVFTERGLTEAEKVATEDTLWGRWSALVLKTGLGKASRQAFSFGDAKRGQRETKFRLDSTSPDFERVADYLSKFGADREIEKALQLARSGQLVDLVMRQRSWGVADEMTKAHLKQGKRDGLTPWQLLTVYSQDPESEAGKKAGCLWRQFAEAFQGKHQLAWSRSLRAHFNLQVEQTDEEIAQKVDAQDRLVASISDENWATIRKHNLRGLVLEILRHGEWTQVEDMLRGVRGCNPHKVVAVGQSPPSAGESPAGPTTP
jgi:hypothetical protein